MVSSSMGKMPQVLPNSGAMLAMVARSASGRPARPSPKNSTNLSTTPFLRSISVIVSTRSVAVAPAGSEPFRRKPITCGNQHGHRLSEHRGLGLDAAHAPAEHAEAIDHGGVRVGADQRVGIGALDAGLVVGEHHARKVLDVDLVHDAGVGRDDLEVAECRLAPAQERIALAVAGELDRVVVLERVGCAVFVHLHGVVDDQFGRSERVDVLRVAAQPRHRLAHGGEVHDHRDTGEVLHDHARRREGDLVARRRLGVPVEQRLDVRARDVHAVFEAQQVLEQDLEGEGQPPEVVALDGGQAEDLVGLAADRQ